MKTGRLFQCVCFPFLLLKRLLIWLCYHQARRKFILACLAVYVTTFVVILPYLMKDLPLTKYYKVWHRNPNSIITEAKKANRRYADLADAKLAGLPKAATKRLYEESSQHSDLEFVVAVVTVRRNGYHFGPRYLTQVMVALHEVLQHSTDSATLFICNADGDTRKHEEAIALSEYFPTVDVKSSPVDNEYEREKLHYVSCLSDAQKFSAKYVLLLQDDALPHKDFYSTLKYILSHRIETQIQRGVLQRGQSDWAWFKLNFPNSLARYEGNYFFALEWISLSALLTGLAVDLLFVVSCKLCCAFNPESHGVNSACRKAFPLFAVFVAVFGYFFLLIWVSGRGFVNLPRYLSESFYTLGPGTSCCLPAVVFPRQQIPGILGYLRGVKLHSEDPLDFAMDNYLQETGMRQYLINPNIFTHIGVESALHGVASPSAAEDYLFSVNYLIDMLPNFYRNQ